VTHARQAGDMAPIGGAERNQVRPISATLNGKARSAPFTCVPGTSGPREPEAT
jgi:hypothetical protein